VGESVNLLRPMDFSQERRVFMRRVSSVRVLALLDCVGRRVLVERRVRTDVVLSEIFYFECVVFRISWTCLRVKLCWNLGLGFYFRMQR
jgi:hypothetical protein